ncbi:MAG TPA: HYR domain-containing protein, partial [Ohtaekwangia sp.]|nr:HYR domain-containing protein [Ohtaekwangia sp.]
NKGTTIVTYTATDAAGNTATCSFNVNVVDNTAPIITGCPANITVNANTSCQALVNWIPPDAVDNCSVVSLTSNHQPGDVFPLGITSVTYTASNSQGISSICTFNIQVRDSAAPIIEGPTDIVVLLENACTKKVNFPVPTIKDCSTVDVTSSHQPGDEFPPGTSEVSFTATDVNGNASTYSFNVTVEDKTGPVFHDCPADVVVDINAACSAIAHWEIPTATDACGNVVVSSSHNPGASFPPGNTTVTYTAVDDYGNISTCTFNVVVESEMPTIVNCPGDILLEAGEDNTARADWIVPTASVQCGEVTLTSSHQPGDIFSIGETTITYEATDHTGKTSYCTFNVIVSLPKIDIGISKVITPDGDGINDSWILDNIDKFKNNKVVVFDRWGSVIYTATGYNNDNVVWQGRNRRGDLVPTGTYYYTISVNSSSEHSRKTGFIELIR